MRREHYNIQTKTVYVDGNIFLNNTIAKPILDIGAYFSKSDFDHIDKIIGGDFILDNDAETSENTYYYAAGDVVSDIAGGGFYSRYHPLLSYDKSIDDIITLSLLDVAEGKDILNRMLFANVYSVMETFMQDMFARFVTSNQTYKTNFLKSHDDLSKQKFLLSEIYSQSAQLDYKIKNTVEKTVFHRFPEIKKLFEGTFGISFPDYDYINNKVVIRHDIVHRNGVENQRSIIHAIDNNMLYELIENADRFVHNLFAEFVELD